MNQNLIDDYASQMEECIAYDEITGEFCGYNHKQCENVLQQFLKLAAERATKAIKNFGNPNKASQSYSPVICKDFAAQLAEAAILDTNQDNRPDCSNCIYFTNFSDVAPCRICQRAGPYLISSYHDYYEGDL